METNSWIWVCGQCRRGKPKVVSKVVPIHCTRHHFVTPNSYLLCICHEHSMNIAKACRSQTRIGWWTKFAPQLTQCIHTAFERWQCLFHDSFLFLFFSKLEL